MNRGRTLLGAANATLGAALLLRPRTVARLAGGARPDPRIVRLLGARQFVQGAVTLAVPSPDVVWLGTVVDAMHAGSLVPVVFTRYRRAALISAALAIVSATAGRTVARA